MREGTAFTGRGVSQPMALKYLLKCELWMGRFTPAFPMADGNGSANPDGVGHLFLTEPRRFAVSGQFHPIVFGQNHPRFIPKVPVE
jgi:hypothetical protein